jgi:hypothetical protein
VIKNVTTKKKLLTAAAIAVLMPGSAFADPWVPPSRGPNSFLAKPDGTAEQRTADIARCREIVHKADSADIRPDPGRHFRGGR